VVVQQVQHLAGGQAADNLLGFDADQRSRVLSHDSLRIKRLGHDCLLPEESKGCQAESGLAGRWFPPYIDLRRGTLSIPLRRRRGDRDMAAATLERWIDKRQMGGRYAFLRREAVEESGLSAEAVKKALQRMTARGRIAKAKDYFYVIVPLEYAAAGAPPASWFVNDLMAAMALPYYVGLLTAAAQHGASHHAPQEFQVVTDRFVRPIVVGRAKIRFFASQYVTDAAAANVKTPTGTMRVSTPETTVVDLVRFSKAAGQLDNVATVVAELSSLLDPKKLLTAVKLVGDIPNAQRLGYVLEHVHARKAAGPLREWIGGQSPNCVPLRAGHRSQDGSEDRRWNVTVDRPLEVET